MESATHHTCSVASTECNNLLRTHNVWTDPAEATVSNDRPSNKKSIARSEPTTKSAVAPHTGNGDPRNVAIVSVRWTPRKNGPLVAKKSFETPSIVRVKADETLPETSPEKSAKNKSAMKKNDTPSTAETPKNPAESPRSHKGSPSPS